jgi:hypothetical protein
MTNIKPGEGPKELLEEAIFVASEELSLASPAFICLQLDGSILSLSPLYYPFHVHYRHWR